MLHSEYCVQHYSSIKTKENLYMIQEYTGCFDLASLLKVRGTLR